MQNLNSTSCPEDLWFLRTRLYCILKSQDGHFWLLKWWLEWPKICSHLKSKKATRQPVTTSQGGFNYFYFHPREMIQFFRIFFSQLAVDWSCRTQMEAGTSDWIIPPWWPEIFVPKHSKTGVFSTNYFLKKQGGFVLWTANNNKKQKLRTPPGGGLDHTFAATFGRGFFLRTGGLVRGSIYSLILRVPVIWIWSLKLFLVIIWVFQAFFCWKLIFVFEPQ